MDPDGLKAGWSIRDKGGHQTIRFLNALDSTTMMEIGLKSSKTYGRGILLTGTIQAVFHCSGTTPLERDLLSR